MAHAEVQSLGVYKFVLNWLSIMWLKKVRYQPRTDIPLYPAPFNLSASYNPAGPNKIDFNPDRTRSESSACLLMAL
jgi:hypothetical protein